ncbi:hypothetical protein F8M41_005487 [Gigaspora margarita]|uniref:C2H2-type domain-containing protein n=1 Tax=Gigaspora margarita TaxID=4874 RepID=A0A8H4A639_GIGMA|nr:hypothetical protein F8M41_005487 [Gigaspora margarita]
MVAKPFHCLLCDKSYANKTSLVTHERKFHNQNVIIPHQHILSIPLYSSYCHFHGLFIDTIQSRLGSHRSTEGKKKIQVHCEENLFYFIFREQETFTFQVSGYKYNCVFKGQAGAERIGKIFQCPNWWIKANKFGGETIVYYQQQDPITKNLIDKEVCFCWK